METAFEQILINHYKADLIAYMKAHPENFEEVIQLAVSDKQPYAWRAAWLLWSCMEMNDPRVLDYQQDIIDCLKSSRENQQRELLNVILKLDIQEELEGLLFNACISIWEKLSNQPSVRLKALKTMIRIVRKHPELSQEIDFLTQSHYLESLPPASQKSVYVMIKSILQS